MLRLFIPDTHCLYHRGKTKSLYFIPPFVFDKTKLILVFPLYSFIKLHQYANFTYCFSSSQGKSLVKAFIQMFFSLWFSHLTYYRLRIRLVGSGFFFGQELNTNYVTIYAGTSHLYIVPLTKTSLVQALVAGRKKKILILSGPALQTLQHVAKQICSLRKPDPYKGKGLRPLYAKIILKTGKKKFV